MMRRVNLHVVSWNLHGVPIFASLRAERMQLAARRMRAMQPSPDIILLQEIFFPCELDVVKDNIGDEFQMVDDMPLREFPPWWVPIANLAGVFMRFRKSGLVAFVNRRWEVVGSQFEEFRVHDYEFKLWEGDGYACKGMHRVDLRHREHGGRVTVFNTHTQAVRRQHEIRTAQITQIAAAAYAVDAEIPVLIAGDFNVRPEEPAYELMTGDFRWQDLTGGPIETCGARLGYAESHREKITRRRDYVFGLSNWRWQFEGSAVEFICNLADDVPYSDHHGLNVKIELHDRRGGPDVAWTEERLPVAAPLAFLAAQTLRGPSTRRAWLLALVAQAIGLIRPTRPKA